MNAHLDVAQHHHLAGADLRRLAQLHRAVHADHAGGHQRLAGAAAVDQDALLSQAKALRALARRLIVQRKEGGEAADPGDLNEFLHAYRSAPHLERDGDGKLILSRVRCGDTTLSLLGSAAEAVAELLIEADFSLVKQCEHPECVLWFYDRTRAHRRRWCSMALCGNRQKAARFRKRAAATGAAPPFKGAQSS